MISPHLTSAAGNKTAAAGTTTAVAMYGMGWYKHRSALYFAREWYKKRLLRLTDSIVCIVFDNPRVGGVRVRVKVRVRVRVQR